MDDLDDPFIQNEEIEAIKKDLLKTSEKTTEKRVTIKFDVDRLLNQERGLPELLNMASHITFRPGREIQDMQRTMAVIELWSHRLFPKYTFKDFLGKCEALGKKRPVKTHLRKARTGQV